MSLETNIKSSFRDVKLEIISIKTQILNLAESQKELRDMILKLQKAKNKKPRKIKKKK